MLLENYVPATQVGRHDKGDPTGIPAPYGTTLPRMNALHLFGEMPKALGLRFIDVLTPWAVRKGDTNWETVERPGTNLRIWSVSTAALNRANEETFGHPVPFFALATPRQVPEALLAPAFSGSPYKYYETQAYYSQTDQSEPPRIWFLAWGERRDMADDEGGSKPIETIAAQIGGRPVYGLQVPRKGSTRSAGPATPFAQALEMQLAPRAPNTTGQTEATEYANIEPLPSGPERSMEPGGVGEGTLRKMVPIVAGVAIVGTIGYFVGLQLAPKKGAA